MNTKIIHYVDAHALSFFFAMSILFIGIYTALGYFHLSNLYNIGCYYAVFLLGISFLSIVKSFDVYVYNICSIACIVMAVWGILQYVGWLPSGNGLFPVTGAFDNPAGIGMFLAILLPYMVYRCRQEKKSMQIIRLLGIILVVVVLLLSGSRTGMLAACIALFCLYVKRISPKYILVLVFLIILICILLYLYKPISANGRLFIWKISGALVFQHLWVGYGMDGFEKGYMLEQAAFFAQFPHSGWAQIADDVKQPFNEYLLFFIRFGIAGILLIMLAGLLLLRQIYLNYSANKLPAMASLSACAVCGCFSYPSHYILIILVAIISLSILCIPIHEKQLNSRRRIIMAKIIGILLLLSGLSGRAYHYYCYDSLRIQLEVRSFDGEKGDTLNNDYKILSRMDYFCHHAMFLYNYGLRLYENEYYEEALAVWEQYFSYRHNYEGQMMYAYTLARLGQFDQAINAFKLASHMLPCRLQPRYELICLYERLGERNKASQCAKGTLMLPLKVHTIKTEYLQNEIRSYLNEKSCMQ